MITHRKDAKDAKKNFFVKSRCALRVFAVKNYCSENK
jgi:hypothetical protein